LTDPTETDFAALDALIAGFDFAALDALIAGF